jgi:hypothetical protein
MYQLTPEEWRNKWVWDVGTRVQFPVRRGLVRRGVIIKENSVSVAVDVDGTIYPRVLKTLLLRLAQ